MKTESVIIFLCFFWINLFAQTPQTFKYQTVVRNSAGEVLVNQNVSFRISILQGAATGTIVYAETHNKTTNAFGLTDLEIGKGTPVTGTFNSVNWSSGTFYLKLELDPSGGTSYQAVGNSQLVSVPYALYARDVQNKDDADADPTNELQKITISGTVLTLDKSGGSVTLPSGGTSGDNWGTQTIKTNSTLTGEGTPSSPLGVANNVIAPSWSNVQGMPPGFADGIDNVDDADNNPDNEIQVLSLTGTQLALSKNGGTVTLPSSGSGDNWGTQVVVTDATLSGNGLVTNTLKIARQSATNGQVLKWDGTSWKPAADEVASGSGSNPVGPAGGDLSGTYPDPVIADSKVTSAKILDGTVATADLADNTVTTAKIQDGTVGSADLTNLAVTTDKLAVNAVTMDKINAGAVTGAKIAQSGATNGQVLKWNSATWAPADDATGAGGLTLPWSGSTSTGDPGSFAFTVNSLVQNATAICGKNTAAGASEGDGVYGESSSLAGSGVYGISKGGGNGVTGKGSTGVYADGNTYGVYARGIIGVQGLSSDPDGYGFKGSAPKTGVSGKATSTTGEAYGVYGESNSIGGYGVYGKATAVGNMGSGVYGEGSNGSGVSGKVLTEGKGVYGLGASTTATNWGVYGQSNSQYGGIGVEGRAEASAGVTIGVKGYTNSSAGYGMYAASPYQAVYAKSTGFQGIAVFGEATADNSIGIKGLATAGNSTGVYGEGAKQGIYGLSAITGVYGAATGYKGKGVVGEAAGTNSIGIQGTATNSNSTGVWGEGDNQGVYGISAMATGKGVYGTASHTTGANYGVFGESASAAGYGVYGKAPLYGVYGISSAANSYGVYGKSSSSTGYGVYGDAQKIGVYGIASSTTGTGVYGEAPKYGVYGFSTAAAGFGVYGISSNASGYGLYGESPKYGAYVKSTGTTGRAVVGEATGTSSIGVWGIAQEANSTGVYGQGASYDFYAAGAGENYGSVSSIRWKRNIKPIPDPVGKIMAIRGVYFDWDEAHGGQHDVGMIAEEVGKVLPEIVVYEENGIDASGMDYSKITPLLVEAIKELKAENDRLKDRLEKLEKSVGATTLKY